MFPLYQTDLDLSDSLLLPERCCRRIQFCSVVGLLFCFAWMSPVISVTGAGPGVTVGVAAQNVPAGQRVRGPSAPSWWMLDESVGFVGKVGCGVGSGWARLPRQCSLQRVTFGLESL